MHTKDDPMKNGQTKPAYNLQIATNNGYAIEFELFQRPTDAKTLVPFITGARRLPNFVRVMNCPIFRPERVFFR